RDFHVTGVQTCALPICAAIHDGHLRAAELQEAVVHAEGVECTEHMFGGVHPHIALAQGGAAGGADHQVRVGVDHGLPLEVGPLEIGRASCRERVEVAAV